MLRVASDVSTLSVDPFNKRATRIKGDRPEDRPNQHSTGTVERGTARGRGLDMHVSILPIFIGYVIILIGDPSFARKQYPYGNQRGEIDEEQEYKDPHNQTLDHRHDHPAAAYLLQRTAGR